MVTTCTWFEFTLPKYGSNYCTFTLNGGLWYGCDTSQMLADARTVIPSSINYETNDIVILAIHGMGIVGLSGGKYKFVSATNGFSVSVIAHEIGHDFNGVLHAAGLDFCSTYPMGPDLLNLSSNGCFLGRYTDSYDTMAAGNSYHFNMFIKEKMGWVNSNQVQVVTNDGDYVLHQVEIVTNQVQVLKIPLANESFYFLEYRTRTGFNGTNTPTPGVTPIDGVLLHLRPSRFPGTDADTVRPAITLNPGVPFIDPYRGFRAEITQKLTNRVVVRITGLNRLLQITDFARTGGNSTNARVQFNSVDGAKYLVETSSNLQSWVAFKTNILATAASTTNTVTNAASPPQNFFRIGVT